MRRLITFQVLFILLCLGCQPATSETVTPTRGARATSTRPIASTVTPSPSPTEVVPTPTLPPPTIPRFEPGQAVTITYIRMIDDQIGWALGIDDDARAHHVLRTNDGGNTWQDVTPPEFDPLPGEVFRSAEGLFSDANNALVLYEPRRGVPGFEDSVVWATQMGWRNWTPSEPLDLMGAPFFEVEFIRSSGAGQAWIAVELEASMLHAWIGLYRVRNSWPKWELVIGPQSEGAADLHYCCKTDMVFVDDQTGIMTFGRGPAGDLFVDWTHDGGLTWQRDVLPAPAERQAPPGFGGVICLSHSPTFFSPQSVVLGVECYSGFDDPYETVSFMYATQDSGETWEITRYPGGELHFLRPDLGWALGRKIYITRNGGASWWRVADVDWDGQFSFVDERRWWAVATDGDEIALMHTVNGGRTWEALEPLIAAP